MSVIPSPYRVVHIPRRFSTVEDEHGNYPRVEDPPVIRYAMSITHWGYRGASDEVISAEYALRTDTTMALVVADPTLYHADDHVMLWPEFDASGGYLDATGVRHWVEGDPSDERSGPWPALLAMFGGMVKLKRVS